MEFLEKDLEQIIWETDDRILFERGLQISGKRKRQLRIGNYGIADLVTFWRDEYEICFEVFELKKDDLNMQTLLQAYKYVKGISTYLQLRGFKHRFYVTLVGRRIDTISSFCFLPDLINSLYIYTYHMNIDGLQFRRILDWNLSNKGFDKKISDGPF